MPQLIFGQILGFAATAATILSYQANTPRKLMINQCFATVFTCISYLLLGADSGFVLNIVCLVRNVSFAFLKPQSTPMKIAAPLLSLAMLVFGIFSWQGPISLLIMLGLAINTFFLSLGKPQVLRYSILLTCTMVLIYNVAVFSMGGILNEAFAVISALMTL